MEGQQIGPNERARKQLFARGIRAGRLTTEEIDEALPEGVLTPSERWLLFYSLRAAQVEIVDSRTGLSAEPRGMVDVAAAVHNT